MRQGRDRAWAGQARKLPLDRIRAGEVALDGARRGRQEQSRDEGPGQGRQRVGHGRPGRRRGPRLPEAAVVALLPRRLPVQALRPLLVPMALRVHGRGRGRVRGARQGRAQARRGHGQGKLRGRGVAHKGRPRPRPLPAADRLRQGRGGRGEQVHDLPLDRRGLRRHEQRRAQAQGRLQAAEEGGRPQADRPRAGALLRGLHGPAGGGAGARLRDGHGRRQAHRLPASAC